MKQYDLSVLIPARNEMFLAQTVKTILEKMRGNTEVIVVLDGQWAYPPVSDDPRVTLVYLPESRGQRAATNFACNLSHAKYVMKIDAHVSLDEGFDVKMIEAFDSLPDGDSVTMIPAMYNLYGFDWTCAGNVDFLPDEPYFEGEYAETMEQNGCGNKFYQAPSPDKCSKCGGMMFRKLVWKPRESRLSMYYRFDKEPHFKYWGEYGNRPEAQKDLVEIMTIQGSCFMLTREKYWELNISDEAHGSWGQQGIEVACKTWLSGGRLLVNKKTWYAHLFRTQGGDFGFPYPMATSDQEKAREFSRKLWFENTWPQAIHPFEWLIEKFAPIPDWHIPTTKKGIIYYTDNKLNVKIADRVRKQIKKAKLPIVSSSLKPMNYGKNIHLNLERGYLTMAKQILAALEASDASIIFFTEHDVLYHPSHFAFVPPEENKYYYNTNVWRVRLSDGHALFCNNLQQLSGLVAYKSTLIDHFKNRVKIMEEWQQKLSEEEFNRNVREMGFEPGTHGRELRVDDLKSENFESEYPNIDIRHDGNLTPSRWNKEQFRNEKYTEGWSESNVFELAGWKEEDLPMFNR